MAQKTQLPYRLVYTLHHELEHFVMLTVFNPQSLCPSSSTTGLTPRPDFMPLEYRDPARVFSKDMALT